MDPFTQGTLGAALSQATPVQAADPARHLRIAGAFGFIAGMAADLDVLIRSNADPLLFLEYHRHFTHSLIFIPIGGLLCAGLLHALWGRRAGLSFRQSFIFCTLGYATHALLDACTSYGTLLLWPFSAVRISWSTVSVIDPLFTLPLAVLVGLAALRRKPVLARIGMAWALLYLGAGLVQRNTAEHMAGEIAAARGHSAIRIEAKPSFGNILVWKTIYETSGHFYVDAVRAGLNPRVFEGVGVPKLDIARDLPWLDPASQQARDIDRFRVFSQDYLAMDPLHADRIIDVRYSLVPNEIAPLWSIALSPSAGPDAHANFLTHRDNTRAEAPRLGRMIWGPDDAD